MEQRDLLKDQIEQIGRILGKILADYLGLKSSGPASTGIEITNQRLQNELDIDIRKLSSLPKDELISYLRDRKLTAEHLEALSEYLTQIGLGEVDKDKTQARLFLEKAIMLLEISLETSRTISFKGMRKQSEIERLLQDLK